MNGNDCLKMIDHIETLANEKKVEKEYELLKSFQKFTTHYLKPVAPIKESDFDFYDELAADLLSKWQAVYPHNKTFKIHYAVRHAPEFVRKHRMSIGYLSEQACESMHSIMKVYDKRYSANERVLAVLRWNRLHMDTLPFKN